VRVVGRGWVCAVALSWDVSLLVSTVIEFRASMDGLLLRLRAFPGAVVRFAMGKVADKVGGEGLNESSFATAPEEETI
jgi:nitrate/nitrite transporter NarK